MLFFYLIVKYIQNGFTGIGDIEMSAFGFMIGALLGLLASVVIGRIHRERREYLGVALKVLDVHRDWMCFEEVFMMAWMMRGALTMTKLPEEDMQEGLDRVVREFDRYRPDPKLLEQALYQLTRYKMAEVRDIPFEDYSLRQWRISLKRFKKKKKREFKLPKLNWDWGSSSPVPA